METERERFGKRALKFAGFLSDPLVQQVLNSDALTSTEGFSYYPAEKSWEWCNQRMDLFITELEKLKPNHPLLKQLQ